MSNHPIEGLMKTAMESIKEMVDVNTVVGDAVEAADGTVIIPVSRVACGFAAGGGEFETAGGGNSQEEKQALPFGGGSGAGVSVQPVGFLVVSREEVRFLSVDGNNAMVDRLIDLAPNLVSQLQSLINRGDNKVKSEKTQVATEFAGAKENH
ncbi:MAG: sporulation protein [Clostridiaceae bacterium BRH_c20a]|nr:MAG: sporulation protein [Clostridiaceae bacterium BRH_c20a]